MQKDPNGQILETLVDMSHAIGGRFDKVDDQIGELRSDMDRQFEDVRGRLDRIERIILEDHAHRLEVLERKVGI